MIVAACRTCARWCSFLTGPLSTLIYTLSLHDALPISHSSLQIRLFETLVAPWALPFERLIPPPIGLSLIAVGRVKDRKSIRLNSSHSQISYAVFCLKKKKTRVAADIDIPTQKSHT